MKIAADDPRWSTHLAGLSSSDMVVIDPPLDLSPKGAQAWIATIQAHLLSKPAGSKERTEFLAEAKRRFEYVRYLFKGRKTLHKYLDDEAKKLEAMMETVG